MKAQIIIKKIRDKGYMVTIDNGYGRQLDLTEIISLDEAKKVIGEFYEKSEFVISE